MVRADALLVLQASNCNDQIPAKLYEYLRAGRPLIALTDPVGDTAGVLRDAGVDAIAPLDSAERIAVQLETLLFELRNGCAKLPAADIVRSASRRNRAEALAGLLDRAAGRGAEIAFRR